MKDNPFLSDTFTRIWAKHFNKDKPINSFNFISTLFFTKNTWLPVYFNIGKNHTKGISYSLPNNKAQDFKKKVFLIYDVPTFFEIDLNCNHEKLKLIKLKQYPGFLVDLKDYSDFDQYFVTSFSKSSRYKLNKYKKRLENCFDISYKMYHGQIERHTYNAIFDQFKSLLEKRFDDKGITNNNLNPKEWKFYHEVTFPLILEKKASLFVIYNRNIPIGVTLNYFSEKIVFDAITVFDIDYEKFHLGSVTIMKLIEWSINQGYLCFDFSKGYYDYKKRWANKGYDFEYHLYYDGGSIKTRIISSMISNYFRLKNYLRDKHLNESFHKITYMLKGKDTKTRNGNPIFKYEDVLQNYDIAQLTKIDYNTQLNSYLKNMVFNYLYLNGEKEKEITLYQVLDTTSCYIIASKMKQQKVKVIVD